MCLSIPPKYSVSTIVGYLKGKKGTTDICAKMHAKKNNLLK
ncbi:MAG: hypothetical protein LWX52_15305 [Deltaproteobacteria bacterium]|nr:hypothetical protein [Deltaproteobacteria bacterium]